MQVIKRSAKEIPKEDAHGGSGSRRLYISDRNRVEGMTHGWLPSGSSFDWHDHKNVEEVMYVIKGSGTVLDNEGEYTYEPGDVFIFPPEVNHRIENNSDDEHEFIFIRVHTA